MTDWKDEFEIGADGRLKRKRVLHQGDRFTFHMLMQDQASGGQRDGAHKDAVGVIDSAGGVAGLGHRPGYILSNDAAVRNASVDLHEQKKQWLSGLWKKRRKTPAPQPWGSERLRHGAVSIHRL
jgi:hypothetical protein